MLFCSENKYDDDDDDDSRKRQAYMAAIVGDIVGELQSME